MSNENIIGPTVKILRHEYLYLHASKLKLLPLCGERLHQMLIRVFFFFSLRKEDLLRIVFGECTLHRIYVARV